MISYNGMICNYFYLIFYVFSCFIHLCTVGWFQENALNKSDFMRYDIPEVSQSINNVNFYP